MPYEVPTKEPEKLTAGDLWTWKKSLPEYRPSDGWALSYALRLQSAAGTKIDIPSSASNDDHLVSIPASATAGYAAGSYQWQAYVTKGNERYKIGEGVLTVEPNFADSGTIDPRSDVKKTLDALNATILGKASMDQLSMSIAGRSIQKMSPRELIDWRNEYEEMYREELSKMDVRNGRAARNRIKTVL